MDRGIRPQKTSPIHAQFPESREGTALFNSLLARISHSLGHHLGFGEDAECKSDEEGWAG